MLTLSVEIGEEVIGAGNHLEVAAVAVPRHVNIPAAVRILDEGEGVLTTTVGEDTFYEVMNRAEIVDEVCHDFFCFRVCNCFDDAKLQIGKSQKQSKKSVKILRS